MAIRAPVHPLLDGRLALALSLDTDRDEVELVKHLRAVFPYARPNAAIIVIADRLLARNGRLVAAIKAHQRGADADGKKETDILVASKSALRQASELAVQYSFSVVGALHRLLAHKGVEIMLPAIAFLFSDTGFNTHPALMISALVALLAALGASSHYAGLTRHSGPRFVHRLPCRL